MGFLFPVWHCLPLTFEAVRILKERGEDVPTNLQMRWQWADQGFTKQMRIENWPDTLATPGVFSSLKQTTFQSKHLQDIIPAMEKARGCPKYKDDTEIDEETALRVVEWTEGKPRLHRWWQCNV